MTAVDALVRQLEDQTRLRTIAQHIRAFDDSACDGKAPTVEAERSAQHAVVMANEYLGTRAVFSALCSVPAGETSTPEGIMLSVLLYLTHISAKEPRVATLKPDAVTTQFLVLNCGRCFASFRDTRHHEPSDVMRQMVEVIQLMASIAVRGRMAASEASPQAPGKRQRTETVSPNAADVVGVAAIASAASSWLMTASRIFHGAEQRDLSGLSPTAPFVAATKRQIEFAQASAHAILLDCSIPPWAAVYLQRTGYTPGTPHALVTKYCEVVGPPLAGTLERRLLACTLFFDGETWLSTEDQAKLLRGEALTEALSAPCELPTATVPWSLETNSILGRMASAAKAATADRIAAEMKRLPLQPTDSQIADCEAAWQLATFASCVSQILGPERIGQAAETADAALAPFSWRRSSTALSTVVFLPSTLCTERFQSIWERGAINGEILPPIIAVIHLSAFVVFCPRCGRRTRCTRVTEVMALFEQCFLNCFIDPDDDSDGARPLNSRGIPFPDLYA